MQPLTVTDFEVLARERLAKAAWDYYASGADEEVTVRENRTAFDRLRIRSHVLVDVSERKLGTTALGHRLAFPVMIAPTAFHAMAHPEGERATARAAGRAGTTMILSTLSNTAVEDVVAAATGPVWFQLYMFKDRGVTRELVERAEASGARALVLTVDAPVLGRRMRDVKNGFQLPEGLTIKNLEFARKEHLPEVRVESGVAAYFASQLDPAVTWKDVDWLCSISALPLVVKGIVRGDDAVRAVEHGAAAVVASNHGGRQLDSSPATIDALPEIAEAVAGRIEVYLDGGVRRGTDVFKALALGARAVLLGRPVLWGLTCAGEDGVFSVLQTLRNELDLALALSGCPDVTAIPRNIVTKI